MKQTWLLVVSPATDQIHVQKIGDLFDLWSIVIPNKFRPWHAAGHYGVQHRFAATSSGICRGGGQQSRSGMAPDSANLIAWPCVSKVARHPEATLKERAHHFGVAINAIWYALRQLKVTRKKTLRYAERDPTKRGASLHQLRRILSQRKR